MTTDRSSLTRKAVLDALSSLPLAELRAAAERHLADAPSCVPVRGPEVGLVMVRGRVGGGGAPFNLGEASVTRASVRLATGELGHALVLGRETEKAALIARLDALGQTAAWGDVVQARIVAPALSAAAARRQERAEETEATRVDFFTLVRGEDA